MYLFVTQRKKHPMVSRFSSFAVLILCALIGLVAPASAKDQASPDQAQAHTVQDEQGWVEQKINPSTEWVEELFYPFIRWVERSVQSRSDNTANSKQTPSTDWPILGKPLPADGLPAKEAARLLLSIHSGRILQLSYDQQGVYQWKHLSPEGRITVFYMDARSGVLLDKTTQQEAQ